MDNLDKGMAVDKKSYYCVHNKKKYRCKFCGGSELCQHDRRKHDCKECNMQYNLTLKFKGFVVDTSQRLKSFFQHSIAVLHYLFY